MKKGTFRKIVALGTGLTMLGATVFGATAAADLGQYPSPLFIQDGKFMGNIVVGKLASTEDVLGAIELAASLQTAAVKKVDIPGATGLATASVDKESVRIQQVGRLFTYNDTIRNVFGAPIDFSDLPTLLAQDTFRDTEGNNKNTETYRQELDFSTSTGRLEFREADNSDMVPNDAADSYLWFDDASNVFAYIYKVDFDTAVTYDNTSTTTSNDDLENTVLNIQGNKYTITQVTNQNGRINKMELLAGETVVWMSQGEPLKRTIAGTDHTVVLQDVNENEDKCGISVDGTTVWVDSGSTEIINGIQIGVTDAITVHSAGKDTDVCQVNVGATKITLEEDKRVKNNDVEVDGSNAEFRFGNSGASARWDGFNITFVPEDKIFLKAGSSWVEPVLQNFQFDFAGMAANVDTLVWDRSGRDAQLTFNNYDGKKVEIDWHLNQTAANNDSVILGSDVDERLLTLSDVIDCGTDQNSCENTRFFYVTSGHVVHILELTRVDVTNSEIDLRDVTYGVDYNDKAFTLGSSSVVDLGSLGTLTITITSAGVLTYTADGGGNAYTRGQAIIGLQTGDGALATASKVGFKDAQFRVSEDNEQLEQGGTNNRVFSINATFDTTDNELDWQDPTVLPLTGAVGWVSNVLSVDDDNNDDSMRADEWGSILFWDAADETGGWMKIPAEQAYANAFISKVGAVVSSGSGAQALELQQIQVGTAKLDTDISDVAAQNLIVVGGPCANSVAATLMGNPADCAAGFTEGEGTIKLWQQSNGNVALLVAGYSALDTRRTTKVLANYKDYAAQLKGDEVTVKGTTLSDITVTSMTA